MKMKHFICLRHTSTASDIITRGMVSSRNLIHSIILFTKVILSVPAISLSPYLNRSHIKGYLIFYFRYLELPLVLNINEEAMKKGVLRNSNFFSISTGINQKLSTGVFKSIYSLVSIGSKQPLYNNYK